MSGARDEPHPSDRASRLTRLLGFRAGLGGRPPNVERAIARQDMKALARALQYPDGDVRETAARGLGQVGGAGTMQYLIPALQDPEWRVRVVAARQIGVLAEKSGEGELSEPDDLHQPAAELLMRTLQTDGEWRVRAATAEALASMAKHFVGGEPQPQIKEALLHALRDEQWAVRRAVSSSLSQMDGVDDLLEAALGDPLWCVRESAARTLGQIGARPSEAASRGALVRPLAVTLRDRDVRVRYAGAKALGRIAMSIDEPELGALALRSLVDALQEDEGRVREAAAEALGRLADARAVKPLLAALNDKSESVRRAASKALDRLAKAQGIHTGPTAD